MSVEIRDIDHLKGKGLVALKSINKGEIIFEETPVCSAQFCWNCDYGYLTCHYCMKSLETPEENVRRLTSNPNISLPYNTSVQTPSDKFICEACGVLFCSLTCKQEAWDRFHQTLCHPKEANHPIELLRETWKKTHYPPESCSIDLILRILAMISHSSNPEEITSLFLQFTHKTENEYDELISKIVKEKFSDRIELLRNLTLGCINSKEVSQWLTPSGFITLLALVTLNGQGIASSPFSQWVRKIEELDISNEEKEHLNGLIDQLYNETDQVVGEFLDNEGSGLYLLQSKCNHSCEPNAEVTFPYDNFKLAMKAKEDIQAGEEICFSYLDECQIERSRHSRQKLLKENYLFICKCPKCERQADDEDKTSDEEEDEEMSE